MFWLLAEYAWLSFTVAALAMFGGTVTMIWHIRESGSGRYVYLLVVAGLLMTIGFVLGGMQAGDAPLIDRSVLIPWIRLSWTLGASLALLFLAMYWGRRVHIHRGGNDGTNER